MCAAFFVNGLNPAFLHNPCGSLLSPTWYYTSLAPIIQPLMVPPWVPTASPHPYRSHLGRELVTWLWAPSVGWCSQVSAPTHSLDTESTACPSLGTFLWHSNSATDLHEIYMNSVHLRPLSWIWLQMVRWLGSQKGRAWSQRGCLIGPGTWLQMRN